VPPGARNLTGITPGSLMISQPYQREIEHSVCEMTRDVVARLARLDFPEAEYLLVELGGLLEIFDLQRQMHDAVHGFSNMVQKSKTIFSHRGHRVHRERQKDDTGDCGI
jgi:hypothetical protein